MTSDEKVRLADVVKKENIVAELAAVDKESAIRELVGVLVASGSLAEGEAEGVAVAILKREKLGSTGIGNGVAVPHAKIAGIGESVGALGRAKEGLDFASLDGARTHTVFLFVSPQDPPNKHIALMSRFMTLLRKADFVSFLRQTDGRAKLHDLLAEVDAW